MTTIPELYGHPFAAYAWKPLIALYEREVAFAFRTIDPDHPENRARN
jgi:glutathione S-transferase